MSSRAALTGLLAAALLGACASNDGGHPPPSACPQPRFTGQAPAAVRARVNPLAGDTAANLPAGEALYQGGVQPACATCHGKRGDGRGPLASQFDPPPRNFACRQTVRGISDGQLFWIIRRGSAGTAMPAFADRLSEEQVWQLVLYLRELAGG